MFKAFWKARWYWLTGFISLILFTVAQTPLHFIWQFAEPHLRSLPVTINEPRGTIWDGATEIQAPKLKPIQLAWQLSPTSLLTGHPSLNLFVDNDDFKVSGQISGEWDWQQRQPANITIQNMMGTLDSDGINPFIRSLDARLSGNLDIQGIEGSFDLVKRKVTGINGQLVFSGGDVSFPVDRRKVSSNLPLVVGRLGIQNENAELAVTTEEQEQLARLFLQPDGWGGVAVRRLMLDLLDQPWADKQATAETVVFELTQKIL